MSIAPGTAPAPPSQNGGASRKGTVTTQVPPRYALCLFIAGSSPRSLRTVANLQSICDRYLHGRVDLEVVDIYQQPELAERHQIVAAPMLLKLSPLPIRRIIGDLSDEPRVLKALELTSLDLHSNEY